MTLSSKENIIKELHEAENDLQIIDILLKYINDEEISNAVSINKEKWMLYWYGC